MTQADSVLSTPPINTSPIQEANPPPEARAESVDSFSLQPGIGQPESQKLTSESGKVAEGLSRRLLLAGLALLPAGLPAAGTAVDPAFALIAEKRAADAAHLEAISYTDTYSVRDGSETAMAAWDAQAAVCHYVHQVDWKLARTVPTTLAGVAAVLRLANEVEDAGDEWPDTDAIGSEGWHYQLRTSMAQAIEIIIRKGAA